MRGKAWILLFCAAACAACSQISFGRRVTDDEVMLRQEVHDYYNQIQEAFATANADGLTALFDPSITHPMTRKEIEDWAAKFFKENKNGHFKIEKLDIESLSYVKASVVLTYRVDTPDHKGDFGGTERDSLVKDHGHWYVAAWDHVDPGADNNKIETIFHAH